MFARKIVRLFGMVTTDDNENEVKVISNLCQVGGRCQNVVEVQNHGWVDNTMSLYFIDMEYCSETLEERIGAKGTKRNYVKDSERAIAVPDVEFQTSEAILSSNSGVFNAEVLDVQFNFEPVAEIVEDIVTGLIYLHENKTVHRDLKPRNGDRS
jgi:serine/threonine protein kinase